VQQRDSIGSMAFRGRSDDFDDGLREEPVRISEKTTGHELGRQLRSRESKEWGVAWRKQARRRKTKLESETERMDVEGDGDPTGKRSAVEDLRQKEMTASALSMQERQHPLTNSWRGEVGVAAVTTPGGGNRKIEAMRKE
jgi:hypothetical protein